RVFLVQRDRGVVLLLRRVNRGVRVLDLVKGGEGQQAERADPSTGCSEPGHDAGHLDQQRRGRGRDSGQALRTARDSPDVPEDAAGIGDALLRVRTEDAELLEQPLEQAQLAAADIETASELALNAISKESGLE